MLPTNAHTSLALQ